MRIIPIIPIYTNNYLKKPLDKNNKKIYNKPKDKDFEVILQGVIKDVYMDSKQDKQER